MVKSKNPDFGGFAHSYSKALGISLSGGMFVLKLTPSKEEGLAFLRSWCDTGL